MTKAVSSLLSSRFSLLPPILGFFALAVLFLWETLFTGKVLLPADNLYAFPPWDRYAAQFGITIPHNELLSDAVLQSYAWKKFAREALAGGQIPLWNPHILGGQPFLAAGQGGVLYPLGILFLVIPLAQAYALYTVLHVALAGIFTFAFLRTIGANRFGAAVSGVTFAFCGFMVSSFIWPMVIGVAVWLPLALLAAEKLIQLVGEGREGTEGREGREIGYSISHSPCPIPHPPTPNTRIVCSILWGVVFASALAMQFLAGHMETSGYLLTTTAFYAVFRLLPLLVSRIREVRRRPASGHQSPVISHQSGRESGIESRESDSDSSLITHHSSLANAQDSPSPQHPTPSTRLSPVWAGLLLAALVGLAAAMAAPQLLPFVELAGHSFRSGGATYEEVVGWAYKPVQLVGFVMPDFFGNPTHHSYQDLLSAKEVPITVNYHGEPVRAIFWGMRNYIEGAAYVGILPLLLAAIALLMRRDRYTWLFVGLAGLSLALAFGTPIYGVLYGLVPGYNQLHTPFRWIFPHSFAVAVLAGLGATEATRDLMVWKTVGKIRVRALRDTRALAAAGGLALGAGLLLAVALALTPLSAEKIFQLAQWILDESPTAQRVFPSGRAFFLYEFRNLAILSGLLMASGLALIALLNRRGRASQGAVIALIVADLFFFGMGFNRASDPKLLEFTPPAVEFLAEDKSIFRIAAFGPGRPIIPNVPMSHGIQDARGYDSVILKDYADFMRALERQDSLLYNRIDSVFDVASLESPLLDLLNVKYVVSRQKIDSPSFKQVYDGDVLIYRNENVIPRAFVVDRAVEAADSKEALRLLTSPGFDVRNAVVIERTGTALTPTLSQGERERTGVSQGERESFPTPTSVLSPQSSVLTYTPNRVEIRAASPSGGYLVLSDTYYPGWRAKVDGEETPVQKTNGAFRAVQLAPGEHTVVFEFKPFSFQAGLFAALVAFSLILLALGSAAVLVFYPKGSDSPLQRLAKNSAFPMATSLMNKLLDLAFAMYMVRILEADGVGRYTFAVVVIGYLDILANFGLGTLLTREVARDHASANRYLGNTLVTRFALWVASLAVVGLLLGPLSGPFGITQDVGLAILLLTVGLLPSLASGTLSALFQAHEKFEYPAGITVITTVLKIVLGVAVLGAGMGIVGLAGASAVVNLATLAMLLGLTLLILPRPRPQFDLGFSTEMLRLSYPLMLNNLLNSLFFRMDSLMLKPMAGDAALGWYGTAYKFIDGLGIISSSFTLALFPMLSRHAGSSREQLARTFGYALKLLLMVSLPICVGTTLIAPELILAFAGPSFLPHSAIALQVLIWFLPFSFVNGVTQYLLIAINQQRFITLSFVVATAFNLATNLVLIPRYGYLGAAITTVLSEWALMVPFWYCIRKEMPPVPVLSILWRPALAAAAMGLEVWLLRDWSVLLAVWLAPLVYAACLFILRAFDKDELDLVKKAFRR